MSAFDEMLEGLSDPEREALTQVRNTVRAELPEPSDGVSYGIPAVFHAGKPVLGLAARRRFLAAYPYSGRVIEVLRERLAGFETTSGAIHFTPAHPLPAELVKAIVEERLAEIEDPGLRGRFRRGQNP